MKITIDAEKNVTIDIPENATDEQVAEALAQTKFIEDIFRRVGKESFFEAFPTASDIDLTTANKIVDAYFDDPESGVHQLYIDKNWDENPSTYFYHAGVKSDLESELSDILDTIYDETDIEQDDVFEALLEADEGRLRDVIYEAMREADNSTPEKSFPSHLKADITFIPDNHKLAIDDMYPSYNGYCFSAQDARPSSNLMRILRFFNVSPSEFVEECKNRGWDPTNPEIPEDAPDYRRKDIELDALTWKSILELGEGTTDFIRQLPLPSKYDIAEWNSTVKEVVGGKDIDRPMVVDMETLFTILDNASYGGVPCFVARVPIKDILGGQLNGPFKVTGGQIGVHDFINGSGYVDTLAGELIIDPSKGKLTTRSIDDVYGMVGSAYKADIEKVEVSGWVHTKENQWIKDTGERVAEISRAVANDGVEEFWVLTKNEDGDLSGPRETSEVWLTLEDAKRDADTCLTEEWNIYAAPTP